MLKIGQHDHVYNKNIRQALKLRVDFEPVEKERSAAVHVSYEGHKIKTNQMLFQESGAGYQGGLYLELEKWAKDGVNFIRQDPDQVLHEVGEKLETAYINGAAHTIATIKNKAVFISSDNTVYRFNGIESYKWFHANITSIMSKNLFQEFKENLNRLYYLPRVTQVTLKNTQEIVLLGETDFGKHVQESIDQEAVNALNSAETLFFAMNALAKGGNPAFREAISIQHQEAIAIIEAHCIEINPYLSEPITPLQIENLKNPKDLTSVLFQDYLQENQISIDDIPENIYDEKLYEYMDNVLHLTRIGQDFPRFHAPLPLGTVEKAYKSRMHPDGFSDSHEPCTIFQNWLEKAQEKNKEEPLNYNAYHRATDPFFSDIKKRAFYKDILETAPGFSAEIAARVVENGSASNMEELIEQLDNGTFTARFIADKKMELLKAVVENLDTGERPKGPPDDSVYL